ncbi:MAG: nucleotidyltransferase domain-containing protein, partial [Melioribacteraceae bacterium]|nr:nucleotidyltransferase domain-containing protein [Melioribacteraceae bacterium]
MNNINQKKLAEFLKSNQNIKFAFIFGSFARKKNRFGSDLDIAVFFEQEPDLLSIGQLIVELEEVVDLNVDLVSLNNLSEKNPKLAYSIIDDGILLFCTDQKLLSQYKKMTYLKYLDFK